MAMRLKPTPPWNVLIFPASSEIGLEIHRALRSSKEVILHGANQPGPSVAAFHFQRLYTLPPVYDAQCLPQLQKLIVEHKIDAIFPAHDDATVWLAKNAVPLAVEVITSPASAVSTCRSKNETYKALKDIVSTPHVWETGAPDIAFPVFVKPDRGQGSQRARRIDNASALAAAMTEEPDLIVLEYLPGREYTVDCFSENGGNVLYARARARLQMKTGISTYTHSATLPMAQEWAERIAEHLNLRGAWFFQIREGKDGQFRLLEVAPRIAGSMAQNRVMGPNFPLLSLYEAAGHKINIDTIDADIPMGRSLDVRFIYDRPIDALYVDLDDTLILREHVNTDLAALIFQCRNRAIPVHLITRHKGNLAVTLQKFRLTQLFDRIIHIADDATPKAQYITEKNAVFIDDSFQERHHASQRGIRCFDPAAALCMFDERA